MVAWVAPARRRDRGSVVQGMTFVSGTAVGVGPAFLNTADWTNPERWCVGHFGRRRVRRCEDAWQVLIAGGDGGGDAPTAKLYTP